MNRYRPNFKRRQISLAEMPPSFLIRERERLMMARNFRLVLRDTVSSSALRIGTTAAKGLPPLTTMIGVFRAFCTFPLSSVKCLPKNRHSLAADVHWQTPANRAVVEVWRTAVTKACDGGGACPLGSAKAVRPH